MIFIHCSFLEQECFADSVLLQWNTLPAQTSPFPNNLLLPTRSRGWVCSMGGPFTPTIPLPPPFLSLMWSHSTPLLEKATDNNFLTLTDHITELSYLTLKRNLRDLGGKNSFDYWSYFFHINWACLLRVLPQLLRDVVQTLAPLGFLESISGFCCQRFSLNNAFIRFTMWCSFKIIFKYDSILF